MDTRVKAAHVRNGEGPVRAPAGARLLEYLALGAEVAVIPGGFAIAIQADHLVETVRLADIGRLPC